MKLERRREIYKAILKFIISSDISYPIDLPTLCEKYNWEVKSYTDDIKELRDCSKDGFTYISLQHYKIFINTSRPTVRQQFTLAHEIGHIVLKHSESDKNVEEEANLFAAILLAPPGTLKKLLDGNYSIDKIANILGVSSQMIQHRLKNLDNEIYLFQELINEYVPVSLQSVIDKSV